jgi:hypothetical protein
MTYQTLDNINTTAGVHTIFQYAVQEVPILTPLILFAFFTIACIGSYYSSIRLTSKGDFPASFAAAGFITSIVAVMFTLIPGMINIQTLVITFAVGILGVVWLFFSRKE